MIGGRQKRSGGNQPSLRPPCEKGNRKGSSWRSSNATSDKERHSQQKALEDVLRASLSVDCKSFVVNAPPPASTASTNRNQHRKRFYKTRLCPYHFKKGSACKGAENCSYAHSFRDLRPSVDLTKTKLCHDFVHGYCSRGADSCPFAHGADDLRSIRSENTVAKAEAVAAALNLAAKKDNAPTSMSSTTATTRNYQAGICPNSNEKAFVKCATFGDWSAGARQPLMSGTSVVGDVSKSCYAIAENTYMLRRRVSGSEADFQPCPEKSVPDESSTAISETLGADPNTVLELTVSQLWTIMIMAHVAESPMHVVKDVVQCLLQSKKSGSSSRREDPLFAPSQAENDLLPFNEKGSPSSMLSAECSLRSIQEEGSDLCLSVPSDFLECENAPAPFIPDPMIGLEMKCTDRWKPPEAQSPTGEEETARCPKTD